MMFKKMTQKLYNSLKKSQNLELDLFYKKMEEMSFIKNLMKKMEF